MLKVATNPHRAAFGFAWLATLCCGVVMVIALALQHGGLAVHSEAATFMTHYLRPRPFLQNVFDPIWNDWGAYQARELSYVFDNWDAQFVYWSAQHGWGHVYSITTFGCVLLMIWSHAYWSRRCFRAIPPAALLLVLLLLVTSPFYFWGGFVFRTSKILAALFLIWLCWFTWVIFIRMLRPGSGHWALLWGVCVGLAATQAALARVDRQGAFLLACYTSLAVIAVTYASCFKLWGGGSIRTPGFRLAWTLCFISLANVLFEGFYDVYLGRWVINSFNGYMPSMDYQSVGLADGLGHVKEANTLVLSNVSFLFGNLGLWFGALILAAIVLCILARERRAFASLYLRWARPGVAVMPMRMRRASIPLAIAGIFVLLVGLIVVSFSAMIYRHPEVLWPDLSRMYYGLPLSALLLFFVTLALQFLQRSRLTVRPIFLLGGLAILLVMNLVMLPVHHEVLVKGHLALSIEQTPRILKGMSDPTAEYHGLQFDAPVMDLIEAVRPPAPPKP